MAYLKHNNGNKKPRRPKAKGPAPAAPAPADPESVAYMGMCEVAEPLRQIAKALIGYAHNSTIGENSIALFTEEGGYPVRLVLEGEAVDRIADSLEHIAEALKQASAEVKP